MQKSIWEYYLCNVELPQEISVRSFIISPLKDYRKRIERLRNLRAQNKSIETVKAKTTVLATEKEADTEAYRLCGLLSFAQGRTVNYAWKFSYSGKADGVGHQVGAIFAQSYGPCIILRNELKDFLEVGMKELSLEAAKTQAIAQALYWYNLAYYGHSIQEYFIKRWIAFEILVEDFLKRSDPKTIVPKERFPKKKLESAVKGILEKEGYCPKEKQLAVEQIGRHLNRLNFMHKAYRFLHEEIQLPHLDKTERENRKKLNMLYDTRNNLFHKGFGSEEGTKEWKQAILLENLVQRVLLGKLKFKNRYFHGNFWDNPFTYAIGDSKS